MTITTPLEPGCFYHVYNRGNNRETIFREPKNYDYFLKLWKKHIAPVAETYAFCLLGNHFHALVKIREDMSPETTSKKSHMNVAQQGFSNFFNAYAKGFNKTYNRTGKLFEERFKKKPVATEHYFTRLIYYIHANPQHHGFVADFREYPHSSYQIMLSEQPFLIEKAKILEWFGGMAQFKEYHFNIHQKLCGLEEVLIELD